MMISPSEGSSKRFKQRRKVLFPEPEGPMIQTTSPSLIETLISFKTVFSPYFLQDVQLEFFQPSYFTFFSKTFANFVRIVMRIKYMIAIIR